MAETKAPEGYKFTEKHEWVKVEGDTALIGISDYAQESLGDIVFVEVPEKDSSISKEDSFGTIESVKAAEDLYAPISGTVSEVNEAAKQNPGDINQSPFETWLVKVTGFSPDEVDALMDSASYKSYVAGLDS